MYNLVLLYHLSISDNQLVILTISSVNDDEKYSSSFPRDITSIGSLLINVCIHGQHVRQLTESIYINGTVVLILIFVWNLLKKSKLENLYPCIVAISTDQH